MPAIVEGYKKIKSKGVNSSLIILSILSKYIQE